MNLISGITSLEFWCFVCIIFTFWSLLGYVIILMKMMVYHGSVADINKKNGNRAYVKDEIVIFLVSSCGFVIFVISFWFTCI